MPPRASKPYALRAGEGWIYTYGIDFTVKTGELAPGPHLAFIQYTTRAGEEPPDHTHETEDEIFYVLRGSLTFRCGDVALDADPGAFVFLPHGVQHGYRIQSDGDVELIVVTVPPKRDPTGGWGGFVADIETNGDLRATPQGVV